MKVATILSALAVAAYCAPSTTPKPEGGVKETSADGHRHHHSRWGYPGYSNPLVDRNVCDLDASVLVVVEGGRRGYNKARRVKCADVAAADEDSCMVCCQNAARRDSSIRNEDIFGFLTVIDHFEKNDDSWSRESHGDDYSRRPKRQAEGENIDDTEAATPAGSDAEYGRKKGEKSLENFEPIMNFRNLKCLCCAPRRQLPVIAVPVPVYNQYPQYPAATGTGYGTPAVAAAQYPVQTQPTYQVPATTGAVYGTPAAQYPTQPQPAYPVPAVASAQYAPAQPTYQTAAPVQNY